MRHSCALVLLAFAAFGASEALAQTETKLGASDGAAGDLFGYSVSTSGTVVIVGAPYDSDLGDHSGAAYVYRLDGGSWVEEQKLTASDGAANDEFGLSVAVSGDVAVIGAQWDDDMGDRSGSAYVYRFDGTTWVEEQKLTASDGAQGDSFGFSVAAGDDVVIIGAYFDDDLGDRSGSAYVYRHDGSSWTEEQKLTATDGAQNDSFGRSVSVSGDVVAVGAVWDDNVAGSAYVFRFDGSEWVEEQKLTASDRAAQDWFGVSVSASADVVFVGAWGNDDKGNQSGSAYLFRFDGSSWVQEKKLTASDGAAGDQFGRSVSVSGDVAVVGADDEDALGNAVGSAYVFRSDNGAWTQEQKVAPSGGAAGEGYGFSVSVSGGVAVIGAPFVGSLGDASGSAYVYHVVAVAVEDDDVFPPAIELSQNYPNPFNPRTSIAYALSSATDVHLAVFDLQGRQVRKLVSEFQSPGEYEVRFDAAGLPSGVYVYSLSTGEHLETHRMVLLK